MPEDSQLSLPSLTVLDSAVPPERRSFPRRSFIAVVVLLFSLAAGVSFSFVSEYFGFIRDSRPDEYEAWRSLKAQVQAPVRGMLSVFRRRRP